MKNKRTLALVQIKLQKKILKRAREYNKIITEQWKEEAEQRKTTTTIVVVVAEEEEKNKIQQQKLLRVDIERVHSLLMGLVNYRCCCSFVRLFVYFSYYMFECL